MTNLTWYVARTATRREHAAERGLREQGFAVYVPCRMRWVRHTRTKTAKADPLFVGYLFVGIDHDADQSCAEVNATEGVHKLVSMSFDGPPAPIPERWVTHFLLAEIFGAFDETRRTGRRFTGERGMTVKITGGQFIGYLATLLGDVGPADRKVRVELQGMGGGKLPIDTDRLKAA